MRRIHLNILFAVHVLFLAWVTSAQSYVGLCCAHCGGNMPMNIMGGGVPETHEFRFKLSQMYMRMAPLRDGTDDVDSAAILGAGGTAEKFPAVPTEMRSYMTMVSAAYSFTDDFAFMVMTGYKRNEMDMLLVGSPKNGFTMFSDGMTDVKMLGKYRLYTDDNLAPTNQLSGVLGVSAPTGSYTRGFVNHPAPAFRGKILPFKMQLGTGTWDPIFGLTYQGSRDPVWYGANFMWMTRLYDNDQGYHAGDEFNLDLYTMLQVHEQALVQFQLNGKYEEQYSDEPDKQKVTGEGHLPGTGNPNNAFVSPLFDPSNYGGTTLNATMGVQFQPIPLHIAELNVTVPVYQNLNGPQLAMDWMIRFTYYIEAPTSKSRRYIGTEPPKELGF